MGNPTNPVLIEGQWNLIATNVVTGKIDRLKSNFTYWARHVLTGTTAPADTETVRDQSPKIFEESNMEPITSNNAIDAYLWIENSDESVDSSPTDTIMVSV